MDEFSFVSLKVCARVFLSGLLFSGLVSSCVAPKTMVYFRPEAQRDSLTDITQQYTPTIQKNDMLSIIVGSMNTEANEFFNAKNQFTSSTTSYGASGAASVQPYGYLVYADGTVELPLIGKVPVGGLGTQDAADTLRKRLIKYLKKPSVSIRFINYKVSVLGEVNRPAVYTIPDEQITLPEVLSLAGDLTITGRRDNIMVVREENGKRAYASLDLTSRKIFDSPYYYLHKNDLVYVEPTKARMNANDRKTQVVPLLVSIVTAVSVILFRFL
jgi:polysaccharide export outer membrane protein